MYKDKNEVVEDSFQAFLVEGANFTEIEEYPIIENWMIPEVPPKKIMPFDKALNYRGDLSDIYMCVHMLEITLLKGLGEILKNILTFSKDVLG